jgi:hypothetical protein
MPGKKSPGKYFLLEQLLDDNVFQIVIGHICSSMEDRINGAANNTFFPGKIAYDIVVSLSNELHLHNDDEAKRTFSRIRRNFDQAVQSYIVSADASSASVYDAPDEPMSSKKVKLCLVKECVKWGVDIIPLSEEMLRQYPDVGGVHKHTQKMYHITVSANVLENDLLSLEVAMRKDEMVDVNMKSKFLRTDDRDRVEKLDFDMNSLSTTMKRVGIQEAAKNRTQQLVKEQQNNNVKQGGGGGGAANNRKRAPDVPKDNSLKRIRNSQIKGNGWGAQGNNNAGDDREMDTSHCMRRGWNNHPFNKGMLACFPPRNPGYAPRRW